MCSSGTFLEEYVGMGSSSVGMGSSCELLLTKALQTCADVFNYPEKNCCACGKSGNSFADEFSSWKFWLS